ncbi:MAG: topoisomerase C-terminal repeat-containing protein, partial [Rhizomicrobium sp.]
ERLDEISAGRLDWKQLLRDFWKDFSASVGETKDLKISQVIDELDRVLGPHIFPPDPSGHDTRKCPACADGRLNLKLGRFGAFVGCTNYPECKFTRQIGAKPGEGDAGPRALGPYPGTAEQVTLRSGRFGPYVQLGEGKKPKRAGLPKGTDPGAVDLAFAVKLLSLPREVGPHPEDGKAVTANFGRFGPYIAHDGKYASLESPDDVFTIDVNHAAALLAEKKASARGRRGPQALKELGQDKEGRAIGVLNGRYGPYVSDGRVNATLAEGSDPMAVTLAEALALIDERRARESPARRKGKGARPRSQMPKRKTPAKKTAARTKKKPETVAGE